MCGFKLEKIYLTTYDCNRWIALKQINLQYFQMPQYDTNMFIPIGLDINSKIYLSIYVHLHI